MCLVKNVRYRVSYKNKSLLISYARNDARFKNQVNLLISRNVYTSNRKKFIDATTWRSEITIDPTKLQIPDASKFSSTTKFGILNKETRASNHKRIDVRRRGDFVVAVLSLSCDRGNSYLTMTTPLPKKKPKRSWNFVIPVQLGFKLSAVVYQSHEVLGKTSSCVLPGATY